LDLLTLYPVRDPQLQGQRERPLRTDAPPSCQHRPATPRATTSSSPTVLGEPWMKAVGMSLSKQIGPEFQEFDFTHDRRTYEVFRGGSGPAVLVLHEIPGVHPGVIDFARRLIAAGYTVYLPSLFGRPAAPATGREVVQSILRVCVAREFTKLADRTGPVVGWLRADGAGDAELVHIARHTTGCCRPCFTGHRTLDRRPAGARRSTPGPDRAAG